MNIRFEDNMIVCHKIDGSRIEFEKAVGSLIVPFSQRAKEFGLEKYLSNFYDLMNKIKNKE
jgi:hypothetical protein